MRLDKLLGGVDVLETVGDPTSTDVTAVCHDHRSVTPGALFCCFPGAASDGHDFAPAAVQAGAAALLCEHLLPLDLPQARVAQVRPAMAQVAATFFGHPSRRLVVVGVTGTNGKTTVTQLLGAIFRAQGWPELVIGTLSGSRTTPEAPALQEQLASHLAAGGRAVAMEVSSHALTKHRVDAVSFGAAVFTNLSHDHLDYHGTMEAYFEAKAGLFSPERAPVGVICADDPWGRRLIDIAGERGLRVIPYSIAGATDVDCDLGGSRFTWRGRRLAVGLGGLFNVANAMAAAAAAEAVGADPDAIAAGLAEAPPVRGRMERLDAGQPFEVVIDYAHTPDGLAVVLQAARAEAPGRLIVVFGCGGDRDADKRPLMGEVAARLADRVIVTSDNPRHEDPAAIIEQVVAGAVGPAEVVVEPDRVAAIAMAVAGAAPGDTVVIAGKGHETGQQVGDVVIPMDDHDSALAALEALR
ncbi:MAG TPA: UDP-N-acetylmuramoyl-L-alanyl-D-glutamate--2,6-diaminopimelate ligase [Acidimicrobiales bacterium]|nr:UDP-N-acetylmuramoyl-L-alanyl-D-glutamate--2,6-diaminopimelate ligase [Acidimicrobiales bacterium]